jgi:membrane-associated phospholipid phosphatase
VSLTQSILAIRYFGRRGLLILALAIGLALGAVYGGFHYVVDVIAGALLGALTTSVGLVIARRGATAEGQAKASAPT